jgi:hypothetical protein
VQHGVHLNLDHAFAVLFIFAYFNVFHLQSTMTLYQQHKFKDLLNSNISKNKRSNAIQKDVSKPKYTAFQHPELNKSIHRQGKLSDTQNASSYFGRHAV